MKSHAKTSCAAVALAMLATGAYAEQKPEYKSKLSGYEFGVGIPLVTPLTGYNVFVGYVNKNAGTWLGRRFGIRADFTIASELHLNASLSDKEGLSDKGKNQYELDAHGKIMGFDVKMSDFSNKKVKIDAFEDDKDEPIKIGQNAVDLDLKIKNQNMGLLIDFYPFADTWFLGGIRLTGGYYFGDFDIKVNANINNDIDYRYKIGNKEQQDILHAQIEKGSRIGADFHWKYHGPYAGLGFDLGIWRGFKFFMDAGVVFAKAPKVTEKNIKDQDFILKGRYEMHGVNSNGEMVEILHGAKKPDVDTIVHDTVGIAAHDILQQKATEYGDFINSVKTNYDIDLPAIDPSALGDDIIKFLNEPSDVPTSETAPWIKTLITNYGSKELTKTINDIKKEWNTESDKAKKGIQRDIDKAWEDYEKDKKDAIKDINDFLEDYGMVPMFKIGFMYRF
ncbi:MAG: hypothetical protein IKN73_04230 [Alphaproteobacteria bacterium]|nr:hypothetical protein [Alphaproteobacteria bacterium]